MHDLTGGKRRTGFRIAIHQSGQEILIERAPVDADTHRLVVTDRHFDDVAELLVLLVLEADIARIDAVLCQRFRAGRMVGEQLVANIVEIADQRHIHAEPQKALAHLRHGGGTLVAIDGDAHDFRTGLIECRDLRHRRIDIRGIRIGHRLYDDRRTATHDDSAHIDRNGLTARFRIEVYG
ncbi:hypothetical protein D3C71_557700 [compost metagenome]